MCTALYTFFLFRDANCGNVLLLSSEDAYFKDEHQRDDTIMQTSTFGTSTHVEHVRVLGI